MREKCARSFNSVFIETHHKFVTFQHGSETLVYQVRLSEEKMFSLRPRQADVFALANDGLIFNFLSFSHFLIRLDQVKIGQAWFGLV